MAILTYLEQILITQNEKLKRVIATQRNKEDLESEKVF